MKNQFIQCLIHDWDGLELGRNSAGTLWQNILGRFCFGTDRPDTLQFLLCVEKKYIEHTLFTNYGTQHLWLQMLINTNTAKCHCHCTAEQKLWHCCAVCMVCTVPTAIRTIIHCTVRVRRCTLFCHYQTKHDLIIIKSMLL